MFNDNTLLEWQEKVPKNREQKRAQMKKYGYTIFIDFYADGSWKVYANYKDGILELLDESSKHAIGLKTADL